MKQSVVVPGLFAPFDRIRIINLAHRSDRRAEMTQQLSRVGLDTDPRVAFFPAVSGMPAAPFSHPGAHGCFLSFMTVLREAADAGQSVLIFEDDCDFLLPDVADFTLPADFDVFYGGYHASDPANPQDSEIIGAHFMGFSARGARTAAAFLAQHIEPGFHVDPRAARHPDYDPDIRPPVDGAFVWMRRAHPELKTVFAQLGVQRASRTDIGDNRLFDRIPVIRDLVEAARRLRRRVRPVQQMTKADFGAATQRD